MLNISSLNFDKNAVWPYTYVMADLLRCKQQIAHLYNNQPALQYRFSDFTKQAWGTDKEACLEEFWSAWAIQNFLLNPGDFEFALPEWHNAGSEKPVTNWFETGAETVEITTETTQATLSHIQANALSWAKTGMWIIVVLIAIVSLWKLMKYLIAFIYDVLNAERIEYFRVIQPRGDSKSDRERAKELAKDMKEKIGKMSQVYSSLHKLWELDVSDNIMRMFFQKPKIVFIVHYEEWLVDFIIGTYPEYRKIVESAIAAQYSDSSMEPVKRPKIFAKKHHNLMPMQPMKEPVYPVRVFKQMEDDPMNNVVDSIAKVSPEDTFTMLLTVKPEKHMFNERAQKIAEALYKKDESVLKSWPLWKKLLPWNLFSFLISGPSEKLINRFAGDEKRGDPMIRMVKAEEEALNIMAEEAGKKAYHAWLMLVSSSDNEERATDNIYNLVSAFTVYSDEYNNWLDQPEYLADLFGAIIKPAWKASVKFMLTWFMYKQNVFTTSEMSSIFHLPDGLYNRSPVIKWMDYKTLAWPNNLPQLKEPNEDFLVTGIIADSYRDWVVSDIIKDMKHDSVGIKEEKEQIKEEVAEDYVAKEGEVVVKEEDGLTYKIKESIKKLPALKTYKDGVLLWINVYRNQYSPVYMKKKDRTRHHYIIGKSGTGKSVYIDMLCRQDIWWGAWVCVIDPHGDLVESILQYVPKHRAKDVIYFDAWNENRPMGLNLYQISDTSEADRAVNDAVEIFIKMFGPEIFGPRIQEYFKYGSLTLLEDMEDKATLIDVPRLFTDEGYRNYKAWRVKNPVVKNFWEKTYNAMGDREKQEIIPYFTSKFVSFITNSLIRNIIGQTESAFDFREVMDNRKILLINLSKGKIWELNAQLLGMIIVSKIYNAAMGRADMAEKDREFFYLYVDEFQNFVTDTFADILSEARKYKLCLIMAHQFIAQLEWWGGAEKSKVKDAVFGNVWTMQSFKVGAPDAEFLEKEYAPTLWPQDILWISNYKAYIKLNINNTTTRVFSMNSIWTQDYKSEKVRDILKKYSEKKYGRKKEFVDAEIAARLWILADEAVDDLPGKIDRPQEPPTEEENTQEETQ